MGFTPILPDRRRLYIIVDEWDVFFKVGGEHIDQFACRHVIGCGIGPGVTRV